MKHWTKLIAAVAAVVMAMALCVPALAFAADDDETGSITITPPSGIDTSTANSYEIYKVFDAVGNGDAISYTVMEGKSGVPQVPDTETNKFFTDDAGNVYYGTYVEADDGATMIGGKKCTVTSATGELTQSAIDAIAAYIDGDSPVKTATSTGTAAATATGLENGYYFIKTTTGTVVTITSTNPDANVNDKNEIPGPPVKTIFGVDTGTFDTTGQNAIAQVGTSVNYSVDLVKVKGAKNYALHDVMGSGLSYNGDAKVYVNNVEIPATADGKTNFDTTIADGDSVTVTFNNEWLASLADDTTITVKYSAKITDAALTVDTGKNTATLEYGNNSKTTGDSTNVYDATFTITKNDGAGKALGGAGFIIKNSDDKYYTLVNNAIVWVDDEDDADVHTSASDGAVPAFTGLATGTYTVIEKVVPKGYNKAADSQFTVPEAAANTQQTDITLTATVVNQSGSTLPSTGGMGTTILYIVGGIMIVVAAIYLVSRRRASKTDKSDDLM